MGKKGSICTRCRKRTTFKGYVRSRPGKLLCDACMSFLLRTGTQ